MARRGLGIGLRAALTEAVRTRRTTVRDGMAMQTSTGLVPVRLTAQPMPELGHGEGLYMLVFQELAASSERRGARGGTVRPDAETVIGQLERELVRTRGDLERAVQDLEAANEELKASNEELLSMNEELQSSNEELETSKEEVQAANAALAAANADLENLLRATRIATVFLDREGRVRGFTPAASEIYPIGSQDLGRPLAHLTHRLRGLPPLPQPEALNDSAVPIEHEAEAEDGRWFLRRVLPYRGAGDEAEGLVVTFLDITRRKADEQALREAEERLRLAEEAGGVGAWEWGVGTDQVHWSGGMWPLLGVPPGTAATAQAYLERVHPEDRDRVQARVAEALEGRSEVYQEEFRILRADDGSTRWLAARGEVHRDSGGALRMRGVHIDVTERRLAEAALRESEAATRAALDELQALYETTPLGLCVLDTELRYLRINGRLAEINGLPAEAHLGRSVREILPALADTVEELARRVLETGRAVLNVEVAGETPAQPGQARVWNESWFPLRDREGRITGIGVVAEDITERRAAEQALARNEHRLRLAMRAGGLVAWEVEPGSGRIVAEDGLSEIFAVPAERRDGTIAPLVDMIHPEDRERVMAEFEAAARPGGVYRGEFRIRRPDGSLRWLAGAGEGVALADGAVHVVGFNADVTARRQAEQLLAEREALLTAVLDNVPVAVVVAEAPSGRLLFGNPGVERVFRHGLRPAESVADYAAWEAYHADGRRVLPEDMPMARVLASGEPAQLDFHYVCGDGVRRWISITGAPIRDASGRLVGGAVVCADVDERRRSVAALEESEARLRLVTEATGIGTFDWDLRSGTVLCSEAYFRIYGVDPAPEGPSAETWLSRVHPEDRARAEAEAQAGVATGEYTSSYRIQRGDGETRWISARGVVLRDAAGQPRRFLGINMDVTERERAVAALAESEERFRQIAGSLDDVFWIAEVEPWRMIYASPAHVQVWGRPPAAPECDLEVRLAATHPEDRERLRAALTRHAAEGGADEEYRIALPNGEERWLRDRVMPVLGSGTARRVAGLTRDITTRRRAEEIRRLMVHELDHRVKNTLAVVQSLAQQTQRATAEQPERFFADFAPRLRALAGAHDLLTQAGWRGAALEEVLLGSVGAHLGTGRGKPARITAEGAPVMLAPGAAVSLSMVFHELATNSAKYGALAAAAGRVAVRWRLEGGALILEWSERGGAAPQEPTRRGFGSRLLQGVVVRELGGELQQRLGAEGLDCQIRLPASARLLAAE
jgi:PAS domain S-box-containing protein